MEIHLKYTTCGIDSDDLEKSQLMFYSMLIVSIAGKRKMTLTAVVSTGCCFLELTIQLAVLNTIVKYMLHLPLLVALFL